jgi:(p)ppGpp synthase/HD superfamily hydrolase
MAKAQTILQLFAQLQAQHYRDEDLQLIHRAYAFAVPIYTCQYRSSGRAMLDHAVGVASILATLRREPQLVAAGVTHAIYLHGDFGTWRKRIVPSKRARMREVVGEVAEELSYRYTTLKWGPQEIPAVRERARSRDSLERTLVLMRLADQLDIYGEHDVLYCNNVARRHEYARSVGPSIASLANELELPALAAALQRAFTEVASRTPPEVLHTPKWNDEAIVPRSYRTRLPLALYQAARFRIYQTIGR